MRRWLLGLVGLLVAGMSVALGQPAAGRAKAAARGDAAVRGVPPLNPPLWSATAVDRVWQQWGLKEKPPDFDKQLQKRYGLHPALYQNQGLPMGLHFSQGLVGRGVVNDCLLCHAGTIAGQTIIGLGNASLDLQGLFDDLTASAELPFKYPIRFSHVRGTIDPVSTVAFLMEFRDLDLNLRRTVKLTYFDNVCSDPPAWWLLKKKKTRNWTGGVAAHSMRIDMVNLLSPFNSPGHIKKQEPVFADIHAFIVNVDAPKFPFPINEALAGQGREIFNNTCARCHGTYGPGGKYPNKIVPLDTVGTDRVLAAAITPQNLDYFNKSWFGREKGPDGRPFQVADTAGYQAPPLDGIWATAPYFHNGSVPTVYHVLNSKARPKVFTRSYGTGKEDYDPVKLGWKITVLDERPAANLPGMEKRKIYDTARPGQGNGGHTFGDDLGEKERLAVIEYLKTL